jgi:hypothetical protein
VAYPEVEGLHGAEDQGQAIVDSTQRPLQGAFLIPPVLPVVLIWATMGKIGKTVWWSLSLEPVPAAQGLARILAYLLGRPENPSDRNDPCVRDPRALR